MSTDMHRMLIRRARWLAWFTIVYNVIEGVVSVAFGAGDESLSLLGFGVDSFIEVVSAVMVLWRIRAEFDGTPRAITRERLASLWISLLLILLGTGTIAGSIWQLVRHGHPTTTMPGVVISAVSLSFMFWLWRSKRAVAAALKSPTLHQDAACSLACMQLSVTLLVGCLLYIAVPAMWWMDSVAAVVISLLIIREGWQGVSAVRRGGAGGCGCGHPCS